MNSFLFSSRHLISTTAILALLAGCDAPPSFYSSDGSDREAGGMAEPVMEPSPVIAEGSMEPVMSPSPVVESPAAGSSYTATPRRGVVTAGDIDDTLNLAAFLRYVSGKARALDLPQASFGSPVLAQLIGPDGVAAPGVRVTLRKPGAGEPFYDGYSGVDGMVTVFPGVLGAGRLAQVELRAVPDANGAEVVQRIATGTRIRIALPDAPGWHPDFLDLVFVLDTTGSMGDELAWLTREMGGIVGAAQRSAPGVSIRYGLIVYRDQGDAYVVRSFGFTDNQSAMRGWLRAQSADGGGDYPEAAAAALNAGVALDWRRGKGERLLIHIADAPPHPQDSKAYLGAAQRAAAGGVQVFELGASGVGTEAEYLMRQAAAMTGGRYLFLTDDSGVGLSHAEPTIPCYQVTTLASLVTRVLQSELSGHRVEAAGGQVLREVGSYASGVCRG